MDNTTIMMMWRKTMESLKGTKKLIRKFHIFKMEEQNSEMIVKCYDLHN